MAAGGGRLDSGVRDGGSMSIIEAKTKKLTAEEEQAICDSTAYGLCEWCRRPVWWSQPHTSSAGFPGIQRHWHTACFNQVLAEEKLAAEECDESDD